MFRGRRRVFGGIGSRIAAQAAGEEPNDLSVGQGSDRVVTEYTLEEFRDMILNPEAGIAALEDQSLYAVRDGIFHIAGYRAAEENFEDALEDEELIRKGSDERRSEYGKDQYELDGIEEIYEFS